MIRRTVPLRSISIELGTQVRGRTERVLARQYLCAMKAGEQFPPLGVADLAGALVLFDGFHRLAAMRLMGMDMGEVEIVACASLEEVRWRAYQANLRHGRPLRTKDRRPALAALIAAGAHKVGDRFKSYRELAGELPGVSFSTIRRWIEADFPAVFMGMGRGDGAAPGGLPDARSPERLLFEAMMDGIAEVEALAASLKRKSRRRTAADRLRELATLLDPEGASSPGGIDLQSYT